MRGEAHREAVTSRSRSRLGAETDWEIGRMLAEILMPQRQAEWQGALLPHLDKLWEQGYAWCLGLPLVSKAVLEADSSVQGLAELALHTGRLFAGRPNSALVSCLMLRFPQCRRLRSALRYRSRGGDQEEQWVSLAAVVTHAELWSSK